MTLELIGTLAVGATMVGLLLTLRRDARADNQRLRAEVRADNQRLRTEVRADMDSLRAEVRDDNQNLRAEVRGDVSAIRKDVQTLTERMSRVEGAIEGLLVGRDPRGRHDAAA